MLSGPWSSTFTGLADAHAYAFTVAATNRLGTGAAGGVITSTQTAIRLQTSPAPVSTSHYPRNWTGDPSHDTAITRAMGATDAYYNPSGHRPVR